MLNAGEGAGAPEDTDDKDWVVVWVVGAEAVAVGGGGLSPAPPSSVAPKGICIGRKGMTTMPVGEEADPVGCAKLGGVTPQFVAVGPPGMPPSKSTVEAEAGEVAVVALPEREQPEFVVAPTVGTQVRRGEFGGSEGDAGRCDGRPRTYPQRRGRSERGGSW